MALIAVSAILLRSQRAISQTLCGWFLPVSTFFPFLIHHIPFVTPPVWFPETHSVIFLIQQIPLGITPRGFRGWRFQAPTYYSSTRSVFLPRFCPFLIQLGFQYAAPLPPRVNSMWFFRSQQKILSVFHPKKLGAVNSFKWLLGFPRPRPMKSV
jgi:hypothetical protein